MPDPSLIPDPGLGHDLTIGAIAVTVFALVTEGARIVLRWLSKRLRVDEPDPRDEEIQWLRQQLEQRRRAGDE